jgi:S-adenosyl methyltransferase
MIEPSLPVDPRDEPADGAGRGDPDTDAEIDTDVETDVARPARVRNYLAGGDDNFAADRKAVDRAVADYPGGMEAARATVRSLAAFMVRAVRYLAAERGVRQFLHIGTPIPTAEDVHVVAQRIAPESRIVYVGNDPLVLAHAHSLRKSTPSGAAAYVDGTLRRPHELLERAAATLQLDRPVAVMLLATMGFVPDRHDPHGIVSRLLSPLSPGSHLVLAHTTDDLHEGVAEAADRLSESMGERYTVRSHAEVLRFFTGLELVAPSLVQIDQWRPDPEQAVPEDEPPVPIYAGVGVKAQP